MPFHRPDTAPALSVFHQGNKAGAEVAPDGGLRLHR
jgi:hypothetical protein